MKAGSSVSGLRKRPNRSGASASENTSTHPSQSESVLGANNEPQQKRPHVCKENQITSQANLSGPRSGHAESSYERTDDDFMAHQHQGFDFTRASSSRMAVRPGRVTFTSATSLLQTDGTAAYNPSFDQAWPKVQPPPPPPCPSSPCSPRPPPCPPPPAPSTSAPTAFSMHLPSIKPKAPLKLLLSDWIDHPGVIAAFADKGVRSLYPWQAAAIECAEMGQNLIYCAPTSGGKSLVAEVLLIRQILRRLAHQGKAVRKAFGKLIMPEPVRALLVLPFVSIVSEKTKHLEAVLKPMGLVVRGYAGGLSDQYGSPLSSKDECLAICTIEKANAAINRLVKEGRVEELACIVVDEAHMVGDPQRGLPLELSLTKIVHASKRIRSILDRAGIGEGESLPHPPQIVCMSATMGGLESMGNWLEAHVFKTNYRPVILSEHAIFNRRIFVKRERMLQMSDQGNDDDACPLIERGLLPEYDGDHLSADSLLDGMAMLAAEVVAVGHSCLVFCAGRSACQVSATLLSSTLSRLIPWLVSKQLVSAPQLSDEDNNRIRTRRQALVADLSNVSGGKTNASLTAMLLEGVAYHHAGLTSQERLIVERGFREGSLLALCCTSTLAAGINLPARRVILRTLWQGAGPVSCSTYLQMIGRAGRAGQSAIGEAFIVGKGLPPESSKTAGGVGEGEGDVNSVKNRGGGEWDAICRLMSEPMPKLKSRLLLSTSVELTDVARSKDYQEGKGKVTDQPGQARIVTRSLAAAPSANSLSHRSVSAGSNRQKASGGTGGQTEILSACFSSDSESKEELAFQQLMLEGVANASATTDYAIRDLLSSTLLSHQLGHELLEKAAKRALSKLRAMGLILPREGLAPVLHHPSSSSHRELLRYWETTPMGTAVYASSLPIQQGMELYQRLDRARHTLILSTPLHPILVSLLDQPLEISGWGTWEQLYRSLSDGAKSVCELEDVTIGYITRMRSGGKGDKEVSRRHGRIAGAWLLHLSFEREAHEVEEAWGMPKSLTEKGFSSGEIQRLQKELANWAGMAAVMCSSAGWWHLETVMSGLAQQAAAGVRTELLQLMQVPMMTGARARALFAAGILCPQDLALSDEEHVKHAVESSFPKMLSKPTAANPSDRESDQRKALKYTKSDPAYLSRAAKSLIQSAREHVVEEAQRAALTVCLQGKAGVDWSLSAGVDKDRLEEETAAIAEELILSLLPPSTLALMNNLASSPPSIPQPPLSMAQMRGRAKVTEISSSTDPETFKNVLGELLEQRSIALAVSRVDHADKWPPSVLGQCEATFASSSAPDSSLSSESKLPIIPQAALWNDMEVDMGNIHCSGDAHQVLDDESEGISVAWRHNECFFFHLSCKSKHNEEYLEQFWAAISSVLNNPLCSKIIFGLHQSLSYLFTLHAQSFANDQPCLNVSGPVLDPQLLYWCIHPSSGENQMDLKHLLEAILPQYAIRLPAVGNQSINWSSRQALAAFALARPLLAMLVTASPEASRVSPLSMYEKVDVFLSVSMARSAAERPRVSKSNLAHYSKWLQDRISAIDGSVGMIVGNPGGMKLDLSHAPQVQWVCHHAGLALCRQPGHVAQIWSLDSLIDKCNMAPPASSLRWLPISGLRERDHMRARLISALVEERRGLAYVLQRTQSLSHQGKMDLIPCLACDGSFTTQGRDCDFIFPSKADDMVLHSQTFLASLQHAQTLEQRLIREGGADVWNGSQVLFVMPYNDGLGEGVFQGILSSVAQVE